MLICRHCSAENPERNQYCGSCGKAMEAPPAEKPSRPRSRTLRTGVALVLGLAVVFGVAAGLPLLKPVLDPQGTEAPTVDPIVSEWHRTRLSQPPPPGERVVQTTVTQITEQPEYFQDRLVRVNGAILGLREADPEMLVSIGEGDRVLHGLYPASREDLIAGQEVSAVGFVSPTGTDMIVLAISPQANERDEGLLSLAWRTLFVSAGFFAAATFVRLRGGIDRRRRRGFSAGVLGAFTLALMLGGCDIGVTTTVSQDGSGTVVTEVEMGEEQMEEILGLPNAQPSVDSWIAELEQQGVTVARGDSVLRMTRSFDSCADFNSVPPDAGEGWSYLQAIEMPGGRHFVFAGLLDTTSLEAKQGVYDEDGQVYEEMRSRTREAVFSSSVVLPGALLAARGGASDWQVGLGGSERLFAESVVRSSARSEGVAPKLIDAWRIGLDWATAAVAGLFVFGLAAYPWRTKRAR